MLADVRNAHLYRDWADHIASVETKDAFRYFVGLAAEDSRYTCHPHKKGEVRDFRFADEQGRQPFAFIVNRNSLLFYFRKPAIQSKQWTKNLLAEHFDSVEENASGELTIKLVGIADVQKLWRLIREDLDAFRSGSTQTTQIGYVNPNNQACGGTRGVVGTDHQQVAYRMECQVPGCGQAYGANGTDVFQRKCPYCQGGQPGIAY